MDKNKVVEYVKQAFAVWQSEFCTPDGDWSKETEALDLTIEALESEQPKGEWIKAPGVAPPEFAGRYVCSNCGHYALLGMPYGSRQELSYFCPNCGADMRCDDYQRHTEEFRQDKATYSFLVDIRNLMEKNISVKSRAWCNGLCTVAECLHELGKTNRFKSKEELVNRLTQEIQRMLKTSMMSCADDYKVGCTDGLRCVEGVY